MSLVLLYMKGGIVKMAFRKKVKNTASHRRYLTTTARTVRAANLFRSTSRGGIRF